MPNARIEVKKSWDSVMRRNMMEAIHVSMIEALQIPEYDKTISFVEHQPDYFISPPNTSDNFTLVEITLFSGRSIEAKKKLYQCIVTRLGDIGIKPKDIKIVLYEVPKENWGIRGGVPASEVDLGFKVEV